MEPAQHAGPLGRSRRLVRRRAREEVYLAQVAPASAVFSGNGDVHHLRPSLADAAEPLGLYDEFWPEFSRFEMEPGDRLLLLTPALADALPPEEPAASLALAPEEVLPSLYRHARSIPDCGAVLLAAISALETTLSRSVTHHFPPFRPVRIACLLAPGSWLLAPGSSILETMLILGIETSCDETAVAVVEDGRRIRSNVVSSQVELHAEYGGVVPELASRQHVQAMIPVLDEALERAGCDLAEIEAVAVTYGPGLAGALLVGLNFAKALAYARSLPLVPVNHLEGHIYAAWLDREEIAAFPCSR